MNRPVVASVEDFASKITSTWRKAARSIIETGQYLLEAERVLPPHQYRQLTIHLVEEAGMSPTVMSKLRMIASNPVLTSDENLPKLPPSYATLYRMTQIEETELTKAFAEDAITSETQLKEIEAAFFANQPRKKGKPDPSITVTFSGDISGLSKNDLEDFRDALDRLSSQVRVRIRGLA